MSENALRFTWAQAFVLFVCLAPFIYAAAFAIPGGDDFDRAVKARYLFDLYEGLHEMLRAWWKWSGRFTHHFLIVFLGDLTESRTGYGVACIGALLAFGVGLVGLCSNLTRASNPCNRLVPALLGLLAVYGGFQALSATAYLLTDILGIWLGSALTIWFLWGLCRLWHAAEVTRSHVWFPACTGVLAIGCYEHSALAVLLAMVAALGLAHYCRHPHYPAFKKLAVVIGTAFALMLFARGNFRRQTKRGADFITVSQQLFRALPDYLEAAGWFFRSVFPFSALMLALAIEPKQRSDIRRAPAALLAGGGLCLFLLLGVGLTLLHAMSDVTILRAGKLPANLALLSGMLAGAVLIGVCGPLRGVIRPHNAIARRASSWLLVLLAAGGIIWGAPNTLAVTAALTSGEAVAAWRENAVRANVAAAASGSLRVAPLASVPYPFAGDPLGAEVDTWPNPHFAKLYGIEDVETAQAPAAPNVSLNAVPNIPGLGKAAFVRSNTGPNATYDAYWLALAPEAPLTGPVHVMFVPAPGPGRLLPQWAQRALLGLPGSLADNLPVSVRPSNVAACATIQPGARLRFLSYTRVFTPDSTSAVLAFPAYPAEDGPLTTVFMSLDGVFWHSIPLR